MAMKVLVDLDACQGYACCMMESPTLFDLDESTGKAIVLEANPADDQRAVAERAVRTCPAKAIAIENG